ncbi:MAG: iron-containing alcohol dehydrogenase, partial [Chloroflexi bacterium]|nr:iron-containing alcohol dehydrogenase [Chloroflexota bacterium]
MRFEFATAARIVFGAGTLDDVGRIAAGIGQRVLVVRGVPIAQTDPLLALLDEQGLVTDTFAIEGEPSIDLVQRGVEQARAFEANVVIGFGGGSAIDTAKAIAALLTNPGQPLDYLEVIGLGQPLTAAAAPCIAIPTTAGTGAEV